MTKLIAVAMLFFILLGNTPQSWADEANSWDVAKIELEKLDSSQCQKRWDILWSNAKSGNQEARFSLLTALLWDGLVFPGEKNDMISEIRNMLILAVHSGNYAYIQEPPLKINASEVVYKLVDLKKLDARKFLNCMETNPQEDCSKSAVEDRLVPSFEDFSKQVDMRIKMGERPNCLPTGD